MERSPNTRRTVRTLGHPSAIAVTLALAALPPAFGAGFAIMEQSVLEMGQAFAGAATQSGDASAVFFNPGAMAKIDGSLATGAGYLVMPSTRFRDDGSQISPLLGGTALKGSDGGNGGVATLIPNLYVVRRLNDRWIVGFGANAPFGVHSDYETRWQGRYQALESLIETVNLNPSVAFHASETLSMGVGLNVQHLYAKLSNALDFGGVCLASLGPQPCAQLGLAPQRADGYVRVTGDSLALGYNLGLLWEPLPDTRVGVSYRSAMDHSVKGRAAFEAPPAAQPLTRQGQFVDARIQAPVALPDTVLLGVQQRLTPQWSIAASALWTHWSRVQTLTLNFDSPQPRSEQFLNWRDTWRAALGVTYTPAPRTALRLGVAYDQSPIRNPSLAIPRIPDSDRIWLTAGASFRIVDQITLHAAYAHLFFDDAPIRSRSATDDRLIGRFANQVDIVGLQMDCRF